MNKFWLIGLVVVFLLAVGSILFWYNQSEAQIGTLNIYNGKVDISRGQETREGHSGAAVYTAETLKLAPASRASIVLINGTTLRLEAGTEMEVVDLGNIVLREGRVWSQINKLAGINYQVETPTITAAVRGTSFDVSYQQLINKVLVENGAVSVFLNAQTSKAKEVEGGQFFIINDVTATEDFEKEPQHVTEQEIDDWVKFNISVDNPSRINIPASTSTSEKATTTLKTETKKQTLIPTFAATSTSAKTQSTVTSTQPVSKEPTGEKASQPPPQYQPEQPILKELRS